MLMSLCNECPWLLRFEISRGDSDSFQYVLESCRLSNEDQVLDIRYHDQPAIIQRKNRLISSLGGEVDLELAG